MKLTARFLILSTLPLSLAGCSQGDTAVNGKEIVVDMAAVQKDLQIVSQARILFGHQSVGRNILAGLESLSAETGIPLRIVEIPGAPSDAAPGIFQSNIGTNGDPNSKCEMFARLLTGPERPHYDLAMMKFCYTDLESDTPLNVTEMIDRYSRLAQHIRDERPDVLLMHATIPLRADPPGRKTFVKRLLGISTFEDRDNALRNAYNDALRERFSGESLFDLAAMESTLPDGSRSYFENDGKPVYTLARAYTQDGGHLSELAQRRAAIAIVQALAAALQSRGAGEETVQSIDLRASPAGEDG